MTIIGNRYEIPNDIYLTLHESELKWKNITLKPGDIFEVMEEYQIFNDLSNSYGKYAAKPAATAIKVNGKVYFIEDESYSTWCFFLNKELDYFIKVN